MEIFNSSDVKSLLHNKFVVIIGDSIQRGIYKDLVLLLQQDRYLRVRELRDKGEYSFLDDELIEGGRKGEMTNGVKYSEVRQYATDVNLVRFYFVTRCYNAYVESILSDLKQEPHPDVIIMNSCLWDITRYGKVSIVDYKNNLVTLFDRFKEVLSDDCLVVWNTTLPISTQARGGFLIPEIGFRTTTLRLDVLEANYYARTVIAKRGFDILDLHFYLRHHIEKRVRDGVHWDMMAHRYITNLLLSHICKAFNASGPGNKSAPFSSYQQQYDGKSLFTNFNNSEFASTSICQQLQPNLKRPFIEKGRPLINNLRTCWTNMVSTIIRGCMPMVSGRRYQNNENDFRPDRDRRLQQSHDGYGHASYITNGPYDRQDRHRRNGPNNHEPVYNGPIGNSVNFPAFSNSMFAGRSSHDFLAGSNSSYFNQSSFEPYQQNGYQGPSHNRHKNRRKPYYRN